MKKKNKPKLPPVFMVNMVFKFTNFLVKLRRKILPPQAILVEYTLEYILLQRSIFACVELFLPTYLEDGPQHIDYIAEKSGMNPNALYRVMRALAAYGIFRETKERVFENTPLSNYLIYGKSGSVAPLAKFAASPLITGMLCDIVYSIEEEKSLPLIQHKKGFFEWLIKHPEEYRLFDEGMTGLSSLSDEPIAGAYDFSKINTLVDVGGGHGGQLATLLKVYPNLKGILFDQPRVVKGSETEPIFNNPIFKGRINFVGGSFFDSVPEGADIYYLRHILHDWRDEEAIKILSSCRKAMSENARLLVVEMVIKKDNEHQFGKVLDVSMLALLHGKERTKEEYAEVFGKSGFKLSQVIPTASPYSIIEGIPV